MKIFCSMLLAVIFVSVMIGASGCSKPAGGGPVPEANAAGDESQLPTEESKEFQDNPKLMKKRGQTGQAGGTDGL